VSVQYQDYYKILGVDRKASQEEISKAYRSLARKYHPDVNKAKGSEDKFKKLNEANEVLKDPEKRAQYDLLGQNYRAGQDFRPPPGFEQMFRQQQAGGSSGGFSSGGFSFGNAGGGFSDFFEMLFGGANGGSASTYNAGGGMGGASSARQRNGRGRQAEPAQEIELPLTVEELYIGGKKTIQLEQNVNGSRSTKTFQISLPPGLKDGGTIRLNGNSKAGESALNQELRLLIKLRPNSKYKVDDFNLKVPLDISPWEAALGAKVPVQLPDSTISITVPPGSQGGQSLRIRGKGMIKQAGERGDALLDLNIVVPKQLNETEKKLFEELKEKSNFQPRG
jgi:curved DNA-binding protein